MYIFLELSFMWTLMHALQFCPIWCTHCVWQALLALNLFYHDQISDCELFFLPSTPWSMHFGSTQCDECTACWKLFLLFYIVPWTLLRPWTLLKPWTLFWPRTPWRRHFGSALYDTHTACCKLPLLFFFISVNSFMTVNSVMHALGNHPMWHTHCMWQAPHALSILPWTLFRPWTPFRLWTLFRLQTLWHQHNNGGLGKTIWKTYIFWSIIADAQFDQFWSIMTNYEQSVQFDQFDSTMLEGSMSQFKI